MLTGTNDSRPRILPDDNPRVRRSDSLTSHAAADSSNLAGSQALVHDLLAMLGPSTDEQIDTAAREMSEVLRSAKWSPSRLRTARAELVEQGLVEDAGFTRTSQFGREQQVWQLKKVTA